MKIQLRSTKNGMKSGSLKRLAEALSNSLGYKVFRTTEVRSINTKPARKQFVYGDAVDKLAQYKFFQEQGISALDFTTNRDDASLWVGQGSTVFGRKLLNASCGEGIVVLDKDGPNPIPLCPVYTLYKKKKREFRVHVFKDKVVTIVEKRLRNGWEKGSSKIRNLANGYVFCQELELTDALRARINELALKASKVCQSDFKGVDLAYNEKNDDLFVIEVNSAPGIEGSNVGKYVEVIKTYV